MPLCKEFPKEYIYIGYIEGIMGGGFFTPTEQYEELKAKGLKDYDKCKIKIKDVFLYTIIDPIKKKKGYKYCIYFETEFKRIIPPSPPYSPQSRSPSHSWPTAAWYTYHKYYH